MKKVLLTAALLGAVCLSVCLSGCTTIFGQDQKTAEGEYVTGALIADAGILSGKETPNIVGDTCTVDDVNYMALVSTRSSADTFSYAPADNANFKLQSDGAPIAPLSCRPPDRK